MQKILMNCFFFIIEFCSNKKLFIDKFRDQRKKIKDQVFLNEKGFDKIINTIKN